ncbi:MAG TPA: VIT family protein [Candidatus Nanopelagicaceae bacterium]|nr:VIT family protein [Candidatus Nanopelagicaceae bacterium]
MPLPDVIARNIHHQTHRTGWLRAAVLGANDGLVSTSSLMIGVAVSGASTSVVLTAGIAGLTAGAMAMAAGEYVSVSSQADIEQADAKLEMQHLAMDPEGELEELTQIYVERGLPLELARKVAETMHEKDALEAHLRDELGQLDHHKARPVQAATASAISFLAGGSIPFLGMLANSATGRTVAMVVVTVIGLALAGLLGARAAGTKLLPPTVRVMLGGSAAMAVTSLIGHLAHVSGI